MTKYLLGFFAIALAVCFSAFTMPKKATTTLKYQLTTFNESEVESIAPTSWLQGSIVCNAIDDKACKIIVDNIYTHIDGQGRRVLNDATYANHITIEAASAAGADYFVDLGASTNITSLENKQ